MKKAKQILFRILFVHTAVAVILVPAAAALLIYAFMDDDASPLIAYFAYFFSAYALAVVCAKASVIVRKARRLRHENKYVKRYFEDVALRVKISLYGSLALNTVYAIMQFALGFYNHSVWFFALSGYYILLALVRLFLLRETRNDRLGENLRNEYLRYRLCGFILILMNIALGVIATYIVVQNRGFSYHPIMTIAMALHTFISFTTALVGIMRYRKYKSPVLSAVKVVSFAAALVSMLSLETAMLSAFGHEQEPEFRRIMTAFTGAAVFAAILSVAVYMIIHANKELNKIEILRLTDELMK